MINGDFKFYDNEISIYIHWPFCKSKCPYCDFYKEIPHNIDEKAIITEYLEYLRKYYELTSDKSIKSIFFGGGTPSLMSPQSISKIINYIAKQWKINSNIEISLEANPNTHTPQMFKQLKNAGINRLSLGVQSLNENELRFLGRTHNVSEARQCLTEIVNIFSNHSADLIYALPIQTPERWQRQLFEICSYGLKHISLYELAIEEGTFFAKKGIKPLNDDEASELYIITHEFLEQKGYRHYEVSNFAIDGYQSIHNLNYWLGGMYIGIGKSAHGRLIINNQYVATEYPLKHEILDNKQRAEELIIMGLRLFEGIDKKKFKDLTSFSFDSFVNKSWLDEFIKLNLVINNKDNIKVTLQGMLLLDQIIAKLCMS